MPDKYAFGLVGYPVEHSLSPRIHMAAMQELGIQGSYRLYPVKEAAGLRQLLQRMRLGTLQGLNVTIPHKGDILPLMDALTPTARAIGAANTVFFRDGQLVGENTDSDGFLADLDRLEWSQTAGKGQGALVLGSGGSARAVVYALARNGWQITIAARRREQTALLIDTIQGSTGDNSPIGEQKQLIAAGLDRASLSSLDPLPYLVINTTPLGMSPYRDSSPWPAGLDFPPQAVLYDLVYNPTETALMNAAREAGLRVSNGLGMLVEQAALSFEIWTGLAFPRQIVREYRTGA